MRTRRQARLQDLCPPEPDAVGEESQAELSQGYESNSPSPSPRRKRRAVAKISPKKVTKHNRRKQGRLSGVLLLPVEVFTEIASHLSPPDIIALSRSNKFFRKLLLNRSAVHIWVAALRNVPGLPPCPKDLCEPQYAALVFSKHCSLCGAAVVKPMDPYLNVRLCNSCRENELVPASEIKDREVRVLTSQTFGRGGLPSLCLRSEKDEIEKKIEGFKIPTNMEEQKWMAKRLAFCSDRIKFAPKLAAFLEESADARTKELEELKTQRRTEIKQRLKEAGWEKFDWIFPWRTARKWASLVEAPKPMTDRVWHNLYPKLVPYLQSNHQAQLKNFKSDRQRRRERRMRALLIAIKRENVLLKVDKKTIRGEVSDAVDNDALASVLDSDGELPSEYEDSQGMIVFMSSRRERQKVVIERPFPPMVDALALPVVAQLLEDDTDANSLEDRFEESREEVEDALQAWSLRVEDELVQILKSGSELGDSDEDADMNSESEVPQLDLQFDLPAEYANFLQNLSSNTRLLLRADSVFRLANQKPSPLPLFYPELFSIIQDRSQGYYGRGFDYYTQTHPILGHSWKTSDIKCYPDGVAAAKLLLEQIERPNATQFELQALGPRFACGLCPDKWVRTWNEIVQHYAEALLNARLAREQLSSTRIPVVFNDIHSPDPALRAKGKNKPLIVFYTAEEAKSVAASQPSDMMLNQCNPCAALRITYRASKEVMAKHIRTVHSIKTPKAEHRTKTNDFLEHYYINTRVIKPRVSESSTDGLSADEERLAERAKDFGMAAYWSEWKSNGLAESDDE